MTTTDQNLITDNQTFDLPLPERITDQLQAAASVYSFLLSGTKKIDISDASVLARFAVAERMRHE